MNLSVVAVSSEAVQLARDSGQVGGLGQSLPSLHDEDQEELHQPHHVQGRPLVSLHGTLQGRREVRVQQRLHTQHTHGREGGREGGRERERERRLKWSE